MQPIRVKDFRERHPGVERAIVDLAIHPAVNVTVHALVTFCSHRFGAGNAFALKIAKEFFLSTSQGRADYGVGFHDLQQFRILAIPKPSELDWAEVN